ncbi:MFS-type transporter SLC18B1-like [Planococcus citri]|uniref:MFS-type transporter SLC18B1-like n=1 Tax=Planococcus citri TaxID=170843 RepID=UPI0031F97E89
MKMDVVSDNNVPAYNCFSQNQNHRRKENNNNMEEEASTDDEDHIKGTKLVRENFMKYKNGFALNSENFDHCAMRTGSDQHVILRSMSLNNALDDVTDLCEVCNYREKMGRNRRRPNQKTPRKFQKHEIMAIFYLGSIDFIGFCSMSVMAPFFPSEAEKKGMDVANAGYVFSFYALIMFLTAPFFGKIMPYVGTKFMFISGVFITGACNILFGMLPYIQSNTQFAIFCFVVRGFEAIGAGAFSTASFIYVIHLFPDNVSSVLGVMETFAGLGMSIGPAFGGFMYAFGGFSLPFYCLGLFMLLMMPLYFHYLPALNSNRPARHPGSFFKLVKIPAILVIFLVIVVSSNAWSFLDPTLEPHLRKLNLSSQQTGFVFLIFSAVYGVFSPIWGIVGDKFNNHWSMMAIGLIGTAASLVFLGPAPMINIESSILVDLAALCLLSISVSLSLAPTFKALLESAFAKGYQDSIATYSIVAGIWSCGYSLGDMTGPTLGGVLLEYFDYPTCTTTMAILALSIASVCLLFFGIFDDYPKKTERPVLHPMLIKDKIAYYGALSSSSGAVNITVTNSGACEV